jgi:CBS domain containing-hemolysin-like protein
VILVILLSISAFFSASETALTSFNKIKMRHLAEDGVESAKVVNDLTEDQGKMISAILIGNNVMNILSSAIATKLAIGIWKDSSGAGVAIATAVMTVLIIIFSEITPKTIASHNSSKIALKVASPITVISKLLRPIVFIFNFIANAMVRFLLGDVVKNQPSITEEELKTIVDVGQEEGIFEQEEKEMIYNVFDFADLHAKDIMTQRIDIQAVDVDITYEELMKVFRAEQFSRMPVYEESIDKVVGIIYIKDLFFKQAVEKNFDIKKYMRPAHFAFEYKMADELFKEINKNRAHMVIVVDEYGGTSGLITVEDLVEEVLGDIEDEYDDYEQEIKSVSENEYLINASTKIDEVNDALGLGLFSEEYDSIGGLMIGKLGHIPEADEIVECDGITIKAENIEKNRVKEVRLYMAAIAK